MRRFVLHRLQDESGVSGTGVVAEGIQFSDGRCVIRWLTNVQSLAIYQNADEVEAVHGHQGKTIILWQDEQTEVRR